MNNFPDQENVLLYFWVNILQPFQTDLKKYLLSIKSAY